MKKNLICFLFLILFSGCLIENTEKVSWAGSNIHEFSRDEKSLYFEYPKDASLFFMGEKADNGELSFLECKVRFGSFSFFPREELKKYKDIVEKAEDGIKFSSYLQDNKIKAYFAGNEQLDFAFWTMNEEGDGSGCTSLVDFLAESVTDKVIYKNEKYNFSITVPDGFEIENLPDEMGVVLTKWNNVEEKDRDLKHEDRYPENYKIEIGARVLENPGIYADLGEYIAKEYEGYSSEYGSSGDFPGVFVDEQLQTEAVRHFFVMKEGDDKIYELYMKVPNVYFGWHLNFFNTEFVPGMLIR